MCSDFSLNSTINKCIASIIIVSDVRHLRNFIIINSTILYSFISVYVVLTTSFLSCAINSIDTFSSPAKQFHATAHGAFTRDLCVWEGGKSRHLHLLLSVDYDYD